MSTEAGRRLLNDLAFAAPELWQLHIDRRIEEAVADERAQIRAAVESNPMWRTLTPKQRAAILAIIDETP